MGVFTRRKKGRFLSAEREMSLCYSRHLSARTPQPGRLRCLDRPCCSLLPLCGQQVTDLPELYQQGEKGLHGETGLPGNVGYPGKEGDQGKLGEKVTDISSFFFLLSYQVPAQSSLYLFT